MYVKAEQQGFFIVRMYVESLEVKGCQSNLCIVHAYNHCKPGMEACSCPA